MKNLLLLFEYVHYRIYRYFHSRGDNISEFTATLLLSLIQCFTILSMMTIVKIIHDYTFPNKLAFLPLLIVVGVLNWYRYERAFDAEELESRWNESPEKRMRNGWLIGLYSFISFLTPAVYGYLTVNLKV